jgi:ATP synthase protein I
LGWPGAEVAVASDSRPDETGKTDPGHASGTGGGDEDLERRRRQLEATLAARRPADRDGKDAPKSGATGFGTALKLSSEFVAGIAVGAGIGLVIDYWAGISPWGLIVFLLLGFVAGVLNVLRSAGMVAEHGSKPPTGGGSS